MGRKRWVFAGCGLAVAAGALTVAVLAAVAVLALHPHGRAEFWLHQDRYEAVVAAVQAQPIQPGHPARWHVDSFATPRLRAPTPQDQHRGAGRGATWAYVDDQGELHVFMETLDYGHAGEWGYAWSSSSRPNWGPIGPEERWSLGDNLGNGWWTIHFLLG